MKSTHPIVLTLNVGSSSLKCKLFEGNIELISLHFADIGTHCTLTQIKNGTSKSEIKDITNANEALYQALDIISNQIDLQKISFVAHRVVHGGEIFINHCEINDEVEKGIDELCALAPLHNPSNLAGIRIARERVPQAKHIACFDTAFHHSIPKYAFLYGLPYNLYEKYHIRKYGFHGLSHEYCATKAYEITGRNDKIITCHLGAGSSICAVHNGQSVDTTMGFTPLDGLLMATRAGELDPDIPLYLMKKEGLSADEVFELLNKKSGLLGLTGHSDLRDVKKSADEGEEHSKTALEMLCYRIATHIGSYFVTVGGAKTITFTGGIGENAPYIRSRVCEFLTCFGVALDNDANESGARKISSNASYVTVLVIPANEEYHMTQIVLNGRFDSI